MSNIFRYSYFSAFCSLFLSVVLVSSLGLHSIQLQHEHPGHTHVGEVGHTDDAESSLTLHEYIHGNEQKSLLAIVLFIISFANLLLPTFLSSNAQAIFHIARTIHVSHLIYQRRVEKLIHNFVVLLFRFGILNPKLH